MTRLGLAGTDPRRRLLGGVAAVIAAAAVGCEGPEPSTLANRARAKATPGAAKQGVRNLEVVTAPRRPMELDLAQSAARIQAGLDTVRVQAAGVPIDAPPGRQAELVREAIGRNPPAIVVEAPAGPDAELDRAADEARAKGILVVALGRPLGGDSTGPGREIVVVPRPFRESAARIVELALRNVANAKADPKAGAVVLVDPGADPLAAGRGEALEKALRDAGVSEVEAIVADGDAFPARLAGYLAAHPKATVVLAADGVGINVAHDALKAGRPFVVAGYSVDESACRSQVLMSEYAAVGVYISDRLFRKGVNLAARAERGEKVVDRHEIETDVIASPVQSGFPKGPTAVDPGKLSAEAE